MAASGVLSSASFRSGRCRMSGRRPWRPPPHLPPEHKRYAVTYYYTGTPQISTSMITKNDHYIAAFIGFFIGIFAIPTFYNLGLTSRWVLALLPPAVALVAFLGMRIAERFAGRYLFIAQFTRFLAVGFMNTSLDFGILNLLSRATGVTSGAVVGGVNIPGFAA